MAAVVVSVSALSCKSSCYGLRRFLLLLLAPHVPVTWHETVTVTMRSQVLMAQLTHVKFRYNSIHLQSPNVQSNHTMNMRLWLSKKRPLLACWSLIEGVPKIGGPFFVLLIRRALLFWGVILARSPETRSTSGANDHHTGDVVPGSPGGGAGRGCNSFADSAHNLVINPGRPADNPGRKRWQRRCAARLGGLLQYSSQEHKVWEHPGLVCSCAKSIEG